MTRGLLNTGPRPSLSSDLSGGSPVHEPGPPPIPRPHTHFHSPPPPCSRHALTSVRLAAAASPASWTGERRRQGIPESSRDSRAPLRIAIPRGKPLPTLPPDRPGRLTGKISGRELRVKPGCCLERRHGPAGAGADRKPKRAQRRRWHSGLETREGGEGGPSGPI